MIDAEPTRLYPRLVRTVRVEAIDLPLVQAVISASEGMTRAEIDAAYRADWDDSRRALGLEIVPPWPAGDGL